MESNDVNHDTKMTNVSKMESSFVSRYLDTDVSEMDSSLAFQVQKFPISLADDFDLSALLLVSIVGGYFAPSEIQTQDP